MNTKSRAKLITVSVSLLLIILLVFFLLKPGKNDIVQTFSITDFSTQYSALINILNETENLSEQERLADISIVEIATGNILIRTNAILNIEYDLQTSETIVSNIMDGPFGFQSIILYDDFNCDGIKDLAIKTGNQGCYGAPSYNVYLGNNKGDFELNSAFTDLAQQFCGFFSYNCESKTIETISKEGSIWHQFQTYNIENGLPVLAKQVVFDDMYYPVGLMLETIWEKGQASTRIQVGADQIRAHQLLDMEMHNSQKNVLLFESIDGDDSFLYFFLVDKDGYIELNYPEMQRSLDRTTENEKAGQALFSLTKQGDKQTLNFEDSGTKYSLYFTPKKVGIVISSDTKNEHFTGKAKAQDNLYNILTDRSQKNLKIE